MLRFHLLIHSAGANVIARSSLCIAHPTKNLKRCCKVAEYNTVISKHSDAVFRWPG
jgi:hypothetical protein